MIAKATRIFGHGVDIAKIARFSQTYQKYGERYLKKALHPNEITQFHNIVDINDGKARFLASRWALKEAVIKASGKRLLFPDIFLYADKSIGTCAHCCIVLTSAYAFIHVVHAR